MALARFIDHVGSVGRCIIPIATVLATAAVAQGAPRHPAPPRCAPRHGRLLAADAQAQVYAQRHLVRVPSYTSEALENEPETVGCALGGRRAFSLGPVIQCAEGVYGQECAGLRRAVVAGTIVAYEQVRTPCDPNCVWRVLVRDLRSGRLLRDEPTGTSTNPAYEERVGIGPSTSIAVKGNGSVAWIVNAGEAEGGYQLHAADTTGSRVLASGANIDPKSLALAGSTLYWTQAGEPFSAPLN